MISARKIAAVLFDLDGTLVEVEMRSFIPAYISGLAAWFTDIADPERFGSVMRKTIFALIEEPDGNRTNEQQFLAAVEDSLAIPEELFQSRFRRFFGDGLAALSPMVRPAPLAREILSAVGAKGLRTVLATNPVFPAGVIDARLGWGELGDKSFEFITSYENSRFCKPHPEYFKDILARLGLGPEECLMVGNDTIHDLSAKRIGITTFLVDDCLVDRPGATFPPDFRGSRGALFEFLSSLPHPAEN